MKGENELKRSFRLMWWILAAASLFPGPVSGQQGRAQVEEGNRLYSEGRFGEAHQRYLEALLEAPESPLIRFNDGNALYQSEDFQRAMERYLEAAASGDPALEGAAWYNLGNALFRQQQLQESLEAYKQALRTNPADADAKHNLERVLEALQEEDQQQQQQEGDEDQEQQEGGEDQPQDQESEDQPDQSQQNPEGQESSEGQEQQQDEEAGDQEPQQPQPQPGEMTQEEAERLLNAIREDPGDVNRKRAPATGKRPRKDW